MAQPSFTLVNEILLENTKYPHVTRRFVIPNDLITDTDRYLLSKIQGVDGDSYKKLVVDAIQFRLYGPEYENDHQSLFTKRQQFRATRPELYLAVDQYKWKDFIETETPNVEIPTDLPSPILVTHVYHIFQGFSLLPETQLSNQQVLAALKREVRDNGPNSRIELLPGGMVRTRNAANADSNI